MKTINEKSESFFEELNISDEIKSGLREMGFTEPTPIQSLAIPKLLNSTNQDFIGLAKTGTGKTAAFAVPALAKVDESVRSLQVLIMSPTRELAQQVGKHIESLAKNTRVKVVVINGGASYDRQRKSLRDGAQICVATPGRLLDLYDQGVIDFEKIQIVILDEADEMISMGFREAIEEILEKIQTRQIWLFSATMNQQIQKIALNYLTNPEEVALNSDQGSSNLIRYEYYLVKNENKVTALKRLLLAHPHFYGLIFCQTKAEVSDLEAELTRSGLRVASLHGDKKQKERQDVLTQFKTKNVTVLVATDVAARGLDIKELTHVVNWSLPWESETFIHRSGRTGRAGSEGVCWSFIAPDQLRLLKLFQNKMKKEWIKAEVPKIESIVSKQVSVIIPKLTERLQRWQSRDQFDRAKERMRGVSTISDLEKLTKEELLVMLLSKEVPEILVEDKSLGFEIQTDKRGYSSNSRPSRQRRDENRRGFEFRKKPHSASRRTDQGRSEGREELTYRSREDRPHKGKAFTDKPYSDEKRSYRGSHSHSQSHSSPKRTKSTPKFHHSNG